MEGGITGENHKKFAVGGSGERNSSGGGTGLKQSVEAFYLPFLRLLRLLRGGWPSTTRGSVINSLISPQDGVVMSTSGTS